LKKKVTQPHGLLVRISIARYKHDDYDQCQKRAGCLWIFPQKNAAVTKPAGEWNESRIKQVNGKIEFYLNGVLTAEQDLTSKIGKT
jgi:hypothetical protein